jgi:hypothetical protein
MTQKSKMLQEDQTGAIEMQLLKTLYYARALAVMPAGLKQVIDDAFRKGVAPDLDDEQDALFTEICGVAPGLVEAYATPAARDARLGPCSPHVEFSPGHL